MNGSMMLLLGVMLLQMQRWLPLILFVVIIGAAGVAAIAGLMVLRRITQRTPLAPQVKAGMDALLPVSEYNHPDESMEEAERTSSDDQSQSPERRRFLTKVIAGLSAVGAAIVAVPSLGVLFSPIRREASGVWRGVGSLDDFPVGQTVQVNYLDPQPLEWAGFSAETAAWVRRTADDEVVALSSYCTHVGCPVRWEEGARMFMCPCHGGAFHENGSVAAGPPPRPLTRYETRIVDGQVQLQTAPIPRADPEGTS